MKMHAMNGDTSRDAPVVAAPVLSAMFGWLGVFQIVDGTRYHHLWAIVTGIALLIMGLAQILAPRSRQTDGRTAARRVSLTAAVCGLILILVASAATMFGLDPVAWYLHDVSVAPSTLVHHPIVFNNQPVHTAGLVSADEHGWCVLVIGNAGATGPGNSLHADGKIALASKGLTCAKSGAPTGWQEISGVFQAFRPSEHFKFRFVLSHVRLAPASMPGGSGGN